ncbi:MAG: DUF4349 domain-containing protein [Acidimicrobiales bacterium]
MTKLHVTQHPSRRRSARSVGMIALVGLLLAGCADSAGDGSATGLEQDGPGDVRNAAPAPPGSAPAAANAEGDATADSAEAARGSEAGRSGGTALPLPAEITALAVGRQIIFTADVVVEAADVVETTADVIRTVQANGGAIWGQETRTTPDPKTVLTIKVPPLEFDGVLDAISGVATVVSQSISTDDVTDTVVDLDARITAAESSVARVQELLDAARDLNTIFSLEEELATRQATLEALRGQRTTIGDQIALATITLTIVQLDPERREPGMEIVAWLGRSVDEACPGTAGLSVGANDDTVLCVGISNTGDDVLTDIEIESSTFRLRNGDFDVRTADSDDSPGSLDSLPPGHELLLYTTLDADDGFVRRVDVSDGVDVELSVTATPETASTDLTVRLTGDDRVSLTAAGDDPLPGFTEAFSKGWRAMVAIVSLILLAVGAALPFVPLVALGGWVWRRMRPRTRRWTSARAVERDAPLEEF